MEAQLNHLVVGAENRDESARFLADILGLSPPVRFGPFTQVETGNGVAIDFEEESVFGHRQHLAFPVTEREFDEAFGRVRDRGCTYWADPWGLTPGEINHNDGGRGVYFEDPSSSPSCFANETTPETTINPTAPPSTTASSSDPEAPLDSDHTYSAGSVARR